MLKPPKLGQMDIVHGRIMAQNPKVLQETCAAYPNQPLALLVVRDTCLENRLALLVGDIPCFVLQCEHRW